MTHKRNLHIRYNKTDVVIFEADGQDQYEVIRWTKDELQATPTLPETIEVLEEMVEESPNALLCKLYGSLDEWDKQKQSL